MGFGPAAAGSLRLRPTSPGRMPYAVDWFGFLGGSCLVSALLLHKGPFFVVKNAVLFQPPRTPRPLRQLQG